MKKALNSKKIFLKKFTNLVYSPCVKHKIWYTVYALKRFDTKSSTVLCRFYANRLFFYGRGFQ